MKMVYERGHIDNKFKDLKNGELFKLANGKYPGCILMKCTNPFKHDVSISVNVCDGWSTDLISMDDEIVRVEGVLTIK